jgi:hypothetical protein
VRQAILALIVICSACWETPAQDQEQLAFIIHRAINIETFIVLGHGGNASFPYYDLSAATYGHRSPTTLKEAGFDAVRLAVEPVPLLKMDQRERRIIFETFHRAIENFFSAGLKVVFDLHMTDRDAVWNPASLTVSVEDEKFKRYLEVVASVSGELGRYDPRLLALELFNEPPCISPWRWSQFQKRMFQVARAALPNHTLVLTGPCFSSATELQHLRLRDYDRNTLFTFHFYRPELFTHQGVPWLSAFKFIRNLPYPPRDDVPDSFIAAMEREVDATADVDEKNKARIINENSKAIRNYFATRPNRGWIKDQVLRLVSWSERSNVSRQRIFAGEFGANRGFDQGVTTPRDDRLRWLEDVRTILGEAGFPWAVWSDCCGFGITTTDDASLDDGVLKSLGLKGSGR